MPDKSKPRVHDLGEILKHAVQALNTGAAERARELAHSVHRLATSQEDANMQAHAVVCLAHCDFLVSRFRRAQETAQRAASQFQHLEDAAGEAEALTILARSAAFLGRNEEAVEASLLAVQLVANMSDCRTKAKAHHALGIAYYFSRSFEKAEAALEKTVEIASQSNPPLSAWQPRLDMAFAEAVRNVKARYLNEYLPKTQRMQQALRACDELMGAVTQSEHITPGEEVWGQACWHLLLGLGHCWGGDLAAAERELIAGRHWVYRYQTTTCLHAMECWLETEISWARADWRQADESVARMVELATRVEHEQLACVGHLLASEIFEAQGKHAAALEEQRRLRRRELRNRAESLDSRARMVEAHFVARRTENTLVEVQENSRALARMALEDSLTGLANRRGFEASLSNFVRQRADANSALSLATIDVNSFKAINDRFSHRVGDLVLQALASIFLGQVREHDLAARIGGDEFAVIFANANTTKAQQVCERFQEAVQGHDWNAIAPGLRVTISLGVINAEPSDTVETLMNRSDLAMYGMKRQRTTL